MLLGSVELLIRVAAVSSSTLSLWGLTGSKTACPRLLSSFVFPSFFIVSFLSRMAVQRKRSLASSVLDQLVPSTHIVALDRKSVV